MTQTLSWKVSVNGVPPARKRRLVDRLHRRLVGFRRWLAHDLGLSPFRIRRECCRPGSNGVRELEEVRSARYEMEIARQAADRASAVYREAVGRAVVSWKSSEGLSQRASAARLGISEGALRDLLRPSGQPRRAKSRE